MHKSAPVPLSQSVQILSPELTVKLEKLHAPLGALTGLIVSLERLGIRYCHWKSNLRLDKSLRGETDLDLLVHPGDRDIFLRTLAAHDVKRLNPASGKDYPGIVNYLGFDPDSGKLFHLHVHFQLVLGEQFVKNYVLPLETLFLEDVRVQHGVRVPCPELELIVLSLRALLKYRDRDGIKDILSIRSGGIPEHILDEIRWLHEQTSQASLRQYLDKVAHLIPGALVGEFLDTIINSPRNGYKLFALRGQVRRALRPYQRHSRLTGVLKYTREAFQHILPFRNAYSRRKMTVSQGGRTIALVGADGSGKSSMSASLEKWLSWKLDARLFYLGSKQPSWLTKTLYALFRMARWGHRWTATALGETNFFTRIAASLRSVFIYSHHISTAHDRYQRCKSGFSLASAGSVVIYDRYPLQAPLDGPRIPPVSSNGDSLITRFFYRLEQGVYKKIPPPELCLVLKVSPEVSILRKPDHDLDTIAAKCQYVSGLGVQVDEGNGWNFIPIDADRTYEEVYRQIKTAVWNHL